VILLRWNFVGISLEFRWVTVAKCFATRFFTIFFRWNFVRISLGFRWDFVRISFGLLTGLSPT